jgi:glycosyltransferase involved in cell wall biosynthesis
MHLSPEWLMNGPKVRYSILVPVYCEAESLVELCDRIAHVFIAAGSGIDFEIVVVDDGSTDHTPDVLERLTSERPYMRALTLRRNCGKSLALSAGFRHVKGEFVVTLDGDLQDQPEDIPRLLAAVETSYDMVNGWRTERYDTLVRKIGSRVFNRFVQRATGLHLHDINCPFKAYRAELVHALSVYGQYHRYIPLQAHLAGFKVGELPVLNRPRRFGVSKFRTFRYEGLFDLLSLLFLNKYGLSPMHFFGTLSVGVIVPSILLLAYFTFEQVLYWLGRGQPVFNRPLLTLALTALLLGGMIFTTGFVCDFFLHHMIRSRLDGIIAMSVSKVSGEEREQEKAAR